jgi:tetratricopeptide (TPR) repeat protein
MGEATKTLYLEGVQAMREGRADDAARLLEEAAKSPGAPAEWSISLGLALEATGRPDDAARAFTRALERRPDHPDAWYCLGLVRFKQQRLEEAASALERAAALSPARAEARRQAALAHRQLGLGLAGSGKFSEAAGRFFAARACGLEDAELLNNLGYALLRVGRLEEAGQALGLAIQRDRNLAAARNNLGAVQHARGELAAAMASYEAALAIDPRLADARVNLALAHFRLGDRERARREAESARGLDARTSEASKNLGQLFRELGELEAALALFRQAVADEPGNVRSQLSLATALLERGEWREGWEHYRWRTTRSAHPAIRSGTIHPVEEQLPEDLRDRRFTLFDEQGLGDVLFFLRFAPALRARGATLAFQGDARLIPLLEPSGLFEAMLPRDAPPDPAREILLVPDLPWLLDASRSDPVPPPFALRAAPERLEQARGTLAALGPRPWIGLTWRAGIASTGDWITHLFKLVSPERLGEALRELPGTLVSVQRGPEPGETERIAQAAGRPVHDLCAANDDLQEVTAVLAALDRYVGVSSTNMHIRAGLGSSAEVLVPFPPEWRWMAEGSRSPWFPGLNVLRESPSGGWSSALEDLRRSLGSPSP